MLRNERTPVTTRVPRGLFRRHAAGTVTPSIDQKEKWPHQSTLDKSRGATWPKDLVGGVLRPAEHPFISPEGVDVIRVPVPSTGLTAPRRGASGRLSDSWSFGGVFVLSARIPVRTSGDEGAGMT